MEKKKKKALITGAVLLVLLLTAVIVILVFLLLKKDESEPLSDEPQGYVIGEENYQQIMEDMQDEVQEGYFETYMNTDWTFPNGTAETTDAILGNSPNNKKPIRCEILLADSEEVIFKTGVLPVGAQLPPFKLDVDLDAGQYEAVCMVYLLDEMEDGTYQDYSNAGFNITITVED